MDIITATSTKTQYNLIQDDILHWAASCTGKPYHAILCDPPYHLVSITKRFGKANSAPAKGGVYRRSSAGFMSQTWDGLDEQGQGIAFQPETWAALGEHLHPGGFLMAFAGTRGYHRMACAIEDAGFIIHPALVWTFLSGFPKATRIDTQIDKAAGNVRPDKLNGGHIGMGRAAGDPDNCNELENLVPHIIGKGNHTNGTPIDPMAQIWAGHRYGLQALKPALEFIAVAQKPYEGRPIDCITQTGAGALNIEAGRIASDGPHGTRGRNKFEGFNGGDSQFFGETIHSHKSPENDLGRWPANLILDNNTCKVLRLRYNIPNDIKQVIREYFNDYSEMRTMPQRDSNLAKPTKEGPGEVLQPGMLRSVVEREQPRRESPNEGEASYSRDNREDKGNQEEKGDSPSGGIASLEGGEAQSEGVLDGAVRYPTPTRARKIQVDGNEKQPSLHSRTSADNGQISRKATGPGGEDSSQERDKGRQSDRESRSTQQLNSQNGASANNQRGKGVEERKRVIEVRSFEIAAPLIPEGWLKYFEDTGQTISYGGAALLDRQSGETTSHFTRKGIAGNPKFNGRYNNGETYSGIEDSYGGHDDSGGASRMFFQSDWRYEILEQLENADPLHYEPKVSTAERNAGLDDPNPHPTLKPISLTKYLSSLLLPPDAYAPRRILCPFSGAGSEMIGAILAGWDEVTGIEKTPAYIPVAEKRLKWWSQWPGWGQTDVDKILASIEPKEEQAQAVQIGMFQ